MDAKGITRTSTSYQEITDSTRKSLAESTLVKNVNYEHDKVIDIEEVAAISDNLGISTVSNYQRNNSEENIDNNRIMNAIKQSNQKLLEAGTDWEFGYQRETERVSIKLIDKETKEVIREIPSEDTLILLEKLRNMTGILIDERR